MRLGDFTPPPSCHLCNYNPLTRTTLRCVSIPAGVFILSSLRGLPISNIRTAVAVCCLSTLRWTTTTFALPTSLPQSHRPLPSHLSPSRRPTVALSSSKPTSSHHLFIPPPRLRPSSIHFCCIATTNMATRPH